MAELDLELANWALDEAKKKGATAAEVLLRQRESRSKPACEWARSKSSRARASGDSGLRMFAASRPRLRRPLSSSAIRSGFHREYGRAGDAVSPRSMGRTCPTRRCIRSRCPSCTLADPDSGIVEGRSRTRDSATQLRRRRSSSIRASRIPTAPNSTPAATRFCSSTARDFPASTSARLIRSAWRRSPRKARRCRQGYWYTSNRRFGKLEDRGVGGNHRGEARDPTPRRAQDQDDACAGRLRSRHGRRLDSIDHRRRLGTVAVQRRVVPDRPAWAKTIAAQRRDSSSTMR